MARTGRRSQYCKAALQPTSGPVRPQTRVVVPLERYHPQVRPCPKTETSRKGLSHLTKLLPHLPRASPVLPPGPPPPLPDPRVFSGNKGVSFRQTLHLLLASSAADGELNVTGSNPGWTAACWAGERGCLPLAGPHEAMWQ